MKTILAFILLTASAFGQLAGMAGEKGVVQGVAPLTITTTSPLPSGTQSSAYSTTMSATGGVLPYTWTCPATCNLQSGLSISSGGIISGTPSVASTVSATIQVADSASHTTSAAFSLTTNSSGGGPAGTAITACNPSVTPESSGGAGTKLTANAGTYFLSNDISCTDSGINIQNNSITVNLHGHTLTYATTCSTLPCFGIYGIGCAESDVGANPCGGNYKSPVIYSDAAGGTITQGAGAGQRSDAIRFGGPQGTQCGGGTIHDITTNITHPNAAQTSGPPSGTGHASASVYFRYCEGAFSMYNVTTNNTEFSVVNRTAFEGPDIRLQNWTNSNVVDIHDNDISGAGQGGVFPNEAVGVHIHNNTNLCATRGAGGHVTQDFCVDAYGKNDEVDHNTVNCTSCRGIFVSGHDFHSPSATGQLIHDNTVTVRMLQQYCSDGASCPNSASFNSCETHGSYALQFDDGAGGGASAYNNTFTGHVATCPVAGLRMTSIVAGVTTHDNTFNIIRDVGATAQAYGYSTEATQLGAPFISTNDSFTADTAIFFLDWQGNPSGATFNQGTFASGSNIDPGGFNVFLFKNGAGSNCGATSVCGAHVTLVDPTFSGSANKDSFSMGSYGGNNGPAEYLIERTYKPTVLCANGSGSCTPGNPVSGATVAISDVTPTSVFSGSTDASGHIASGAGTILIEFRRANCLTFDGNGQTCTVGGGAVFKEMHTPHSVSITKAGCTTLNYTLDLTLTTNGSISENRNLACP